MSQYGFLELDSIKQASVCLGTIQEKKYCGKQGSEFMSKQSMYCPFHFLSFLTHKHAEIFHMSSKRRMLYGALPVKCNENIHMHMIQGMSFVGVMSLADTVHISTAHHSQSFINRHYTQHVLYTQQI